MRRVIPDSSAMDSRLPAILGRPAVAAILCLGALVFWTALMVDSLPRWNKWDYSLYYIEALAMRQGGNPYVTDITPLGAQLGLEAAPIKYADLTPTFLLIFEPLTRLSPASAHLVWIILGCVAYALSLFILLASEPGIDRFSALSIAAIMCFFPPLIDHFQQGQAQVFILLLLALAMRLLQGRSDRSAGLMLAAATLLRFYPAALAGYLLVRRKWRSFGWMIAGIAVGGALTASILGVERSWSFFTALGLIGGHKLLSLPDWLATRPNISMDSFLTQALSGVPSLILIILKMALSLIFVGLAAGKSWSNTAADLDNRIFALWTATMLAIAPVVWLHYLVILLLVYAQMIAAYARGRLTSTTARFAAISVLWIVVWSGVVFKFGARMNTLELKAMCLLAFPCVLLAWMAAFSFASERGWLTVAP